MNRGVLFIFAAFALSSSAAHGFCGFYVAKADSRLFNKASQVALVRDGSRTVLTTANDYEGDPKEFAIVVPWTREPPTRSLRLRNAEELALTFSTARLQTLNRPLNRP